MDIHQGDIFWLEQDVPDGSEPGYRRPVIVIQNDAFNKSTINTTVVVNTTTNLKRAQSPGNILLDKGEGGLAKDSVVNISQIATIHKTLLTEKVGTLKPTIIRQIIIGIKLLIEPRLLEK